MGNHLRKSLGFGNGSKFLRALIDVLTILINTLLNLSINTIEMRFLKNEAFLLLELSDFIGAFSL